MKKLVYILLLLPLTNTVNAQFLKKLKSKVSSVVGTADTPPATTPAAPADGKFTDPAKFGILIKTYTKGEINTAMGGEGGGNFGLHFLSFKVVNNQFVAQIADVLGVYDYQNGKLQATGQKPPLNISFNDAYNGSEKDFQSKDFSSIDTYNATLKKGPHIQSGRQPGKIDQDFVFNGKSMGRFMSAMIAHNQDSSVVVAAGMSYGKGVSYVMTSSTGQTITLPGLVMSAPLISPNGKMSAVISTTAAGSTAYLMNGTKVVLADYGGFGWIRNSGAIFFPSARGNTVLVKNNKVAQVIQFPMDLKQLFIGANDDAFCWPGDHCLCFSDNTKFENADFPVKVTINGKDVVYFTAVNVITGMLYLCHHDL
ncbi:hypothetical protein [Mucilaginibacter dorajii]|uniref:Uncharacterized protein n=1 Tax=Mucilaginibacter dorajii TaxID=692994 RepID=A0ABP7QXN3_9SPHI|nr:hypothetical protein [Mucilaginibacter dorajii]MCS3732504.1 hypothetical protein [Mucilaginibacter dorajii]